MFIISNILFTAPNYFQIFPLIDADDAVDEEVSRRIDHKEKMRDVAEKNWPNRESSWKKLIKENLFQSSLTKQCSLTAKVDLIQVECLMNVEN